MVEINQNVIAQNLRPRLVITSPNRGFVPLYFLFLRNIFSLISLAVNFSSQHKSVATCILLRPHFTIHGKALLTHAPHPYRRRPFRPFRPFTLLHICPPAIHRQHTWPGASTCHCLIQQFPITIAVLDIIHRPVCLQKTLAPFTGPI
jgi:hypothetical protein